MLTCPDCLKGALLPGEPSGYIGFKGAYYAPALSRNVAPDDQDSTDAFQPGGNPTAAVVLLTDGYGLKLKNCKIIADTLSQKLGCDVWIPDIFDGRPLIDRLLLPERAGVKMTFVGWARFIFFTLLKLPAFLHSTPAKADVRIHYFLKGLQNQKGYTNIGVVGYCFGGAAALRLASKPDLIRCAVICHPGLRNTKDVALAKVPVSWACAEDDLFFSHKVRLEAEAVLSRKEDSVDYEFVDYKGKLHSRHVLLVIAWKEKQRIGNDPRNLVWADDAARFGSSYLSKFGWDPSKGLGAAGDGRISHLKVSQKLDMLGIGAAQQRDPNGIAWKQNRDFENLLKRLNENAGETDGSGEVKDVVMDGFKAAVVKEEEVEVEERQKDKKKRKKQKTEEDDEGKAERKKKRKAERDEKKVKTSDDEAGAESSTTTTPGNATPTPTTGSSSSSSAPSRSTSTKPITLRHRAHRARAIAAKSISSKSSAAIAEILGVASSSNSTAASAFDTPVSGVTPSEGEVFEAMEKLTTSTKSVADYFKEKLLLKSRSGTATPAAAAAANPPTAPAEEWDDVPRRGLGSSMSTAQITTVDTEMEIKAGLGNLKFSQHLSTMFSSSSTETKPSVDNSKEPTVESVIEEPIKPSKKDKKDKKRKGKQRESDEMGDVDAPSLPSIESAPTTGTKEESLSKKKKKRTKRDAGRRRGGSYHCRRPLRTKIIEGRTTAEKG
ncbi:hypothetical protein ONZ45_g12361 [Pleurotus djamor]|nr:hypothetical protein ONZ45_g12361 [Pleurotus djamor]